MSEDDATRTADEAYFEYADAVTRRQDSDVHYHIIAGMGGGYMPDDYGLVDSLDDAIEYIREEIAQHNGDDPEVPARVFDEVEFDHEEGWAYSKGFYPEDVSPHDLGWYFEATRSADSDPDHEDCRAILNGEKEAPLV